jgi:hypothetical protein
MKNLELMGVQEMDAKEMINVDGGMTDEDKKILMSRGPFFYLGWVSGRWFAEQCKE